MQKPLETAWVGLKVRWGRESPGWGKKCEPGWWSLRYGTYLPACSVALLGGGLSKGTVASACTSVWEKAALPPALALMPDNSVPPHMSLVLFSLLPLC